MTTEYINVTNFGPFDTDLEEEKATAAEMAPKYAEPAARKKPLSFRATDEQIEAWKAYCLVSGIKMQNLIESAVIEYISNHPLSGADAEKFKSLIS